METEAASDPAAVERGHCKEIIAWGLSREKLLAIIEGRRQQAIRQRDVELRSIPEDERDRCVEQLNKIIAEDERVLAEIRASY